MKTNQLTRISLMLALLVVCSQFAVPIGPVPITLQTLIILIIGLVLPAKMAVITTGLYLVIGLIGMPVFAQGTGGFHSVLSPSFGFILSFIPATWFMAKFLEKSPLNSHVSHMVAVIIGNAIIYSVGLLYMNFILSVYMGNQLTLTEVLWAGMIPFLPGDVAKSIVAVIAAKQLQKQLHFEIA